MCSMSKYSWNEERIHVLAVAEKFPVLRAPLLLNCTATQHIAGRAPVMVKLFHPDKKRNICSLFQILEFGSKLLTLLIAYRIDMK